MSDSELHDVLKAELEEDSSLLRPSQLGRFYPRRFPLLPAGAALGRDGADADGD